MVQKKGVLGGLIIALIGIGLLVAFSMRPIPILGYPAEFSWGISVGDEFLYNVTYTIDSRLGNGSIIVVTITNLPELPTFVTERSFRRSIAEAMKASYTFDNGSEAPILGLSDSAISSSILPIGGWETIDALYPSPDSVDDQDVSGATYLSQPKDDCFLFGYHRGMADAAANNLAEVSYDNGIPEVITFWWYSLSSFVTYTEGVYGEDWIYYVYFTLELIA
ncbi:MAG: hypothetical protein ACFFD6_01885 [Candidatus Thorarchaeota archaeon]